MPFNHYNPHNPMVVGDEYAPVVAADYTPELFVERGYSFLQDVLIAEYQWLSMFVSQLPPWPVPGHGYLFSMYRRGQEGNTGPLRKLIIPVVSTATSNVTVVNGGGSATTALENPTDNSYVRMGVTDGSESYIRAGFDTGAGTEAEAILDGKRIVNVSVLYSAFTEPGNEEPLPVQLYHRRNSDAIRINMGTLNVPLSASSILAAQEQRIGELNSFEFTEGVPFNPLTEVNYRIPWRYGDRGLVDLRSAGDQRMELYIAAASVEGPREVYLQYVALEVTYCEENRVGYIGFIRGADYDASCVVSPNGYQLGRNTFCGGIGMVDPTDITSTAFLDTRQGTVTLKRADYGPYNNAGPPAQLRALRTITPFPDHPGVAINLTGQEGETPTVTVTDLVPQIIMHDPDGPAISNLNDPSLTWGHTYGLQVPLDVYNLHPVVQEIEQFAEAPDTPYPWVTFWARSLEATAPLRIEIETQSQGMQIVYSLTPQAWAALPEIADGWRKVVVQVDTSLIVDDDGTVLTPAAPRFASDTAPFQPWQVLASRLDTVPFDGTAPSDTGIGTYGDQDAQGGVEGAFPDTADIDVSVHWSVQMPDITGLDVDLAVQDLAPADPTCPGEIGLIPTGLYYLSLTWDAVPDGYEFVGLGHYELQRRDTTMDDGDWETIATPDHPLAVEFDDYEARIGVEVAYRIRYVHTTGVPGAWSESVTIAIPSPGSITDTGVPCAALLFTTNADPSLNVAYPTSWTGQVDQAQTFVEADTRVLQRFHRRDYQGAFRPAERGGVAFTRSLLVNSVSIPVEALRVGAVAIRDLAWADIPYVCVRDRLGDRWLSNLNIPSISIRNNQRLQVVEAIITEVTDTPFAPSPSACEGMRTDGGLPGIIYAPRYASTPGGAHLDSVDFLEVIAEWRSDGYQEYPLVVRQNHVTNTGWVIGIGVDGVIVFNIADGAGDVALFASDADAAPAPGVRGFLRVRYNANGPGGPSTAQMATSTDGVVFGDITTNALLTDPVSPTFTSIPLTVGASFDGTVDAIPGEATGAAGGWNGVVQSVQVSGDSGVLADPDFSDEDAGTTEFTDGSGNEWFISGGGLCGGPS